MIENPKVYTKTEENINIWSHFIGIIFSIVGLVLLIIKGINLHSNLHIISYSIYGISMIVLFFASTLYHSTKAPELRKKRNIFDHIAIYFLIAGTYTPFTLIILEGVWGWSIFSVVWGIASIGFVIKLFFTGRFNIISTIGYIIMGLVIIVAIKPLSNSLSHEGLMWLMVGGLSYVVGAVLYLIKRIPFNHAIFHIFVLLGALCHYIAVYFYV